MRRARAFAPGILAAVFGVVALVAWAFASPVGATPDEDFHLTSVWCGQGYQEGFCERGSGPGERLVPLELLLAPQCYAFHPTESAACQEGFSPDPELVSSDRGNFSGEYPPVFYWVMNLFAGRGIVRSVLLMRIFNALLAVALVGAVAVLSPPGVRRAVVTSAVVTAVPLGMFLLPSVNPSGWGLVGALCFTPALVGYLVTEGRRRWALAGLAAVSLLVGAGARFDAALFAALGAVVAVTVGWKAGRRHLTDLVVPVLLGAVALVTFLSSGASAAGQTDDVAKDLSVGHLFRLLGDVPSLWIGTVTGSGWGLGWLDTAMPAVVPVIVWGVLAGAVFSALPSGDRRHQLALLAVGAALWLVPTYMQVVTGYDVGAWVQPRYIQPLVVMLVALALLRVRGAVGWRRVQWLLVVVGLSIANSIALFTTLRRFVTGNDVGGIDLDRQREWWWPGPIGPVAVWIVGSLAFAVAAALLLRSMRADVPESSVSLSAADPSSPDGGATLSGGSDGATSGVAASSSHPAVDAGQHQGPAV